MAAVATNANAFAGRQERDAIRAWIEHADGSIARGRVAVLSTDGAVVRIADAASASVGDDVAVRLSFSPDTPTLAGRARILSIRPSGDATDCEIRWTHTGPERERLAQWVAAG